MKRYVFCILAICCVSLPAGANQVQVNITLSTGQDDSAALGSFFVEELGVLPDFPVAERIAAGDMVTTYRACYQNTDSPGIPNEDVQITNISGRAYKCLYYVADPETTFQNYDKNRFNGLYAFKIDNEGANNNLLSESGLADGIFSPGETWHFAIQDYQNSLGICASHFTSLGVPGAGDSSGSIVGTLVPEPATCLLVGLGGLGLLRRRRA